MKKGFLPKKTLGKRVIVRFDDHSIGDETKTICEVSGYVTKLNESEIILRWWVVFSPGTIEAEADGENHECCRILQGTFIEWAYDAPKKWNKVG